VKSSSPVCRVPAAASRDHTGHRRLHLVDSPLHGHHDRPGCGGLDAEIPRAACPSRSASATVARWDNGEIDEEIFYDLVTIMRQIGLSD
jgi:hypothetical protein